MSPVILDSVPVFSHPGSSLEIRPFPSASFGFIEDVLETINASRQIRSIPGTRLTDTMVAPCGL